MHTTPARTLDAPPRSIEQARADRAASLVRRMGATICAIAGERGQCTPEDLAAAGFTPQEVAAHGNAATAHAAALLAASEAGTRPAPRLRPCPVPLAAAAPYPPRPADPAAAEIDAIQRRFDGPIPDAWQQRVAALEAAMRGG